MSTSGLRQVGIVVIGRNEGERLKQCLRSIPEGTAGIVYVDSGSTDGSVEFAREIGVDAVELDLSIPFTAARARNEGVRRLLETRPAVEFVQFIDGDCELAADWIESALDAMQRDGHLGVACGRRRERHPERSVYNLLCDLEWNTPVGPVRACGGDALVRVAAFRSVGGFREDLIAGEEPEMCLRMRELDWRVRRLDAEMTLHDAAMSRFSQFLRRALRCGHAYAEGWALHGGRPHRYRARELRSLVFWTILLPAFIVGLAWPTGGWSLVGLLMYLLLWWRIQRSYRSRAERPSHARIYALYCIIGKFAELAGVMSYFWNRVRGRRRGLIEYKGDTSRISDSESVGRATS